MGEEHNNEKTWLKSYYFATFILAIVAVFGFFFSIKSSRHTSDVLNEVANNLFDFTAPVIGFDSYEWFIDIDIPTCLQPPVGILMKYKNNSVIPLVIKNGNIEISYGDKPFSDIVSTLGPQNKSFIVAPGDTFTMGQSQKENF